MARICHITVLNITLALGLTGCASFPQLDTAESGGVADAPYPGFLPLEAFQGTGDPPRATEAVIGEVTGRVAGLEARAGRLRSARSAPDALTQRVLRLRQKAAALRARSVQ